MANTNHNIYWLRLEDDGRNQEQREYPPGVNPIEWKSNNRKVSWFDYSKLQALFRKIINEIQPDIIHAGPVQRVALLPALTNSHPLITMSWGFDLLDDANRNIFWNHITRYVIRKSDWMLADCQTVKREINKFDFPEDKITVFPWGVNLKFFSPSEKSKKKKEVGFKKDFLIIHTRSWEPRYGVDIALQGFKIAVEKIPNLHMIMLGGGSQDRLVREFIQSSNLSNQVHLYGYQENEKIATFYQAADVYLSASHIDGSSVALMEAMACGCPAIVSDIPSNLEWVTDRKEGLTFHDGDAIDLARKIIDIADQREDLSTLGKAARKKVEEFANWENGVQKLLKTYQTVRDLYRNTKKG